MKKSSNWLSVLRFFVIYMVKLSQRDIIWMIDYIQVNRFLFFVSAHCVISTENIMNENVTKFKSTIKR